MPRGGGSNSKSLQARERKKSVADAKRAEEEAAKEDLKWRDDDKHANSKLQRKNLAKEKLDQKNQKKAEQRQLEVEEMDKLASITVVKDSKKAGKDGTKTKVTQAEINFKVAAAAKQSKAYAEARGDVSDEYRLLQPNINQQIRKELEDATENNTELIYASGVEESLQVLSLDTSGADKHPERRMKAAHIAFEQKMMPIVREENPTFTRSQLKQLLWKKWQVSPDNPHNLH